MRDAAAEALGTATKLVGEKNIAPHIGKIDNLKEQKIKEFADKVQFYSLNYQTYFKLEIRRSAQSLVNYSRRKT